MYCTVSSIYKFSAFESQCNSIVNRSIVVDGVCYVKEGPGKQFDAVNGCKQLSRGKLMTQHFPDKIQTIITALGGNSNQVRRRGQ